VNWAVEMAMSEAMVITREKVQKAAEAMVLIATALMAMDFTMRREMASMGVAWRFIG